MRKQVQIGDYVRVKPDGKRAKTGRVTREEGVWWYVENVGWFKKDECTRIRASWSAEVKRHHEDIRTGRDWPARKLSDGSDL